MKKIVSTIVGLSLLAGGTLFAQENIVSTNEVTKIFYPIENSDTPDYLLEKNESTQLNSFNVLSKSTISDNVLTAIYPVENSDIPDYLIENKSYEKSMVVISSKGEIDENALCAIYPPENDDSSTLSKSC